MEPEPVSICPSPLSTVWEEETESLIASIARAMSGNNRNIAVISEYLAGREDLVSNIECSYPHQVTRITFDSFIDDLSILFQPPNTDIIILENCQFLARRTIHGFDLLDRFIRVLLRNEKIWITTWNIHSWRYLCAVTGIEGVFPEQILLTYKTNGILKEFILSQQTSPTSYIINAAVPRRLVAEKRTLLIKIPFIEKVFLLDYLWIRFPLLWAILRRKGHEVDPDELIFLRLTQVSGGNPGIALKIWRKARTTWEIRMSDLSPPPIPPLSDPDTAYLVSLIISLENPTVSDLITIMPEEVNTELILGTLIENGLFYRENNRIFIEPLALAGLTSEMKRMRMVW